MKKRRKISRPLQLNNHLAGLKRILEKWFIITFQNNLPQQPQTQKLNTWYNPAWFYVKLWNPHWAHCICEIPIIDAKTLILYELLNIMIIGISQMQQSSADLRVWHADVLNYFLQCANCCWRFSAQWYPPSWSSTILLLPMNPRGDTIRDSRDLRGNDII